MEQILFPFAYTSNLSEAGSPTLTVLSKMSVVATELVSNELDEPARIVIAGEQTFGPHFASTGELMSRALKSSGVGYSSLTVLDREYGGKLNNTTLQVRALARYLSEAESTRRDVELIGIVHAFHAERAKMLMDAYGVTARIKIIEDVIMGSPLADQYREIVEALSHFEGVRERVARSVNSIERKGRISILASRILGAPVHDIKYNEKNGKPEKFAAKAWWIELGRCGDR